MANGSADTTIKAVLGVLCAICLSLSAWALTTIQRVSERVELLDYMVEQLQCNKDADVKQNESLSKHWRLHGWARDEINDLRHTAGLESSRWPDL